MQASPLYIVNIGLWCVPLPTGVRSSGTEATSCLFLDSQCLTQSRLCHAAEFMFALQEGVSVADRSNCRLQTAHLMYVFLAFCSHATWICSESTYGMALPNGWPASQLALDLPPDPHMSQSRRALAV